MGRNLLARQDYFNFLGYTCICEFLDQANNTNHSISEVSVVQVKYIKKQQKFYSLPKQYKQTRRLDERPAPRRKLVGELIPDERPLLEMSNLLCLYRLGSG